ncbi:MAG: four helix bundle protein [Candidatus Brocadiaceae bacterium]|nr:four helix bundle protein [Candidatus Brocadiaceae bacterium]
MIKRYRDLIVWQKAMKLVTQVYRETKLFPREELYSLVPQIRKSVVSIPGNIAEGYGGLIKKVETSKYLCACGN